MVRDTDRGGVLHDEHGQDAWLWVELLGDDAPEVVRQKGREQMLTKHLPGQHDQSTHGRKKGAGKSQGKTSGSRKYAFQTENRGQGTKENPVKVKDVEEAVQLLAEGLHVELPERKEVSTLLHRLKAVVDDAKSKGEEAPNYDLCKVSVPGTNLFCAESKGIPRVKMPQVKGRPVPGSKAAKKKADDEGEVDLTDEFIGTLRDEGVGVERGTEVAAFLKASQSELVGANVAGMATSYEAGKWDPSRKPIFISRDNYVIDGHHRWAAVVGVDLIDGQEGDLRMNVYRVDMPILDVLDRANAFAEEWGIAPKVAKSLLTRLVRKALRWLFINEPGCVDC